MGTLEMMAPATNHNLLPTVDTIVGGVASPGRANSWVRKSAPEPEEPPRKNLSDPEQPWLRTVLLEIRAVAALEENWDSYGAGPVKRDILWYALRLLQSVMEDFPAPQLTPMSHEGILLEWLRDGVRLEIEIENAGEAHVTYQDEENGIDESWELKANFTSLSQPLRAIAGKASSYSSS